MENAKKNEKKDGKDNEFKWFMIKRVFIGLLIAAVLLIGASMFFELFEETAVELAETVHETAPEIDSSDAGHETAASHEEPSTEHTTEQGDPATRDDHEAAPAVAHEDPRDHEETARKGPAESMEAFLADLEPDNEPADHPEEPAEEHDKEPAGEHDEEPAGEHDKEPAGEQHAVAEKAPEPAEHPKEPASEHDKKTAEEKHADVAPDHEAADHPAEPAADHAAEAPEDAHAAKPLVPKAKGVAFVEAVIAPLDYELHERFWGWRTNDIVRLTDNVNSYQLGVLEVTRRTVVILAERLSRIGSTASFDEDLEQAMNWFMIKPGNYWFPSPESKYEDGLDHLRNYVEKLEKGEASFYTRADNLIPLLLAYKDLMGSCDENLAKATEKSGLEVSFFKSDDYFYYAQGVAGSMGSILDAVHHDFHEVLQSRNGVEALHHAIESCHRATAMDPWIVLDSSLSSIFANHRANMAAAISHAKFYLEVMIQVLST